MRWPKWYNVGSAAGVGMALVLIGESSKWALLLTGFILVLLQLEHRERERENSQNGDTSE